jgi:hypothetical protein
MQDYRIYSRIAGLFAVRVAANGSEKTRSEKPDLAGHFTCHLVAGPRYNER